MGPRRERLWIIDFSKICFKQTSILEIFFHEILYKICEFFFTIYKFNFSCLFVSNKRLYGRTDQTQILCGTSHDPKEDLWRLKITKIVSKRFRFLQNFENARTNIIKSANFFVMFYIVHKENNHR